MGENGKIILSNKRKSSGKLGTIITEHWMLFPEEIEEAIKSALDSGMVTFRANKLNFSEFVAKNYSPRLLQEQQS